MSVESVGQNSIVVANQVNPTIFTPTWLAGNVLESADVIQPGAIVSPQFVQLQTADFHLLVLPERIQVTPRCSGNRQGEVARRIMGGIVHKLEHTPYTAAGLNFQFLIRFPADEFSQRVRTLFRHNNPPARFFDAPDALFGAYYSQDYLGCRLKLSIKPGTVPGNPDDKLVEMDFNFHKEVAGADAVAKIDALLSQWDDARRLANEIAHATHAGNQ